MDDILFKRQNTTNKGEHNEVMNATAHLRLLHSIHYDPRHRCERHSVCLLERASTSAQYSCEGDVDGGWYFSCDVHVLAGAQHPSWIHAPRHMPHRAGRLVCSSRVG